MVSPTDTNDLTACQVFAHINIRITDISGFPYITYELPAMLVFSYTTCVLSTVSGFPYAICVLPACLAFRMQHIYCQHIWFLRI
ncbi:conserved protein of unknown function [Tepidanaerobacter acetatoxydans Re1]|uniref:Uncharacterized protein n=1 Tax=Tepidanaerobacter acetatoxydans (strain DSM 21804 / JCM 16047 / Re1) TaxID=1209989 RepID=F4LUK4_TEPAE|nr:hypothetical protein TepRe1_2550 [Tepidanaerobacter acetatoxydans Re1]CDI41067.1 conserved protein of unknown function [Tepidanaerobacter acetatoxydans Re1]